MWFLKYHEEDKVRKGDEEMAILDLNPIDLPGRTVLLLNAMYSNEEDASQVQEVGATYCKWYLGFIKHQFLNIQDAIAKFRPERQQKLSLIDFHTILIATINWISRERLASVDQVSDFLRGEGLVSSAEEYYRHTQQLAFTSIGLLTMLFVPVIELDSNYLSIAISHEKSTSHQPSKNLAQPSQPIAKASDPIIDVLRRFGEFQGDVPRTGPSLRESHTLVPRELNFYHLRRLGDIQIRWVDSLCQHLEFNRRSRTLMIFRYPSFCAMLSYGKDPIFLDQLFLDYFDGSQGIYAKDFLKELLTTYRLLFGQDKRSWNLCRKMLSKQTLIGKWRRAIIPSKRPNFYSEGVTPDPLLRRLCCHDANDESLYDELYIPDIRSVYSAQQDFPFFGQRLLALQEYIRLLQPYDIRTLWYDRRDTNRFYTIWAVIIFSLITILLSLLGLGLAAGQLAGSFR